MQAQVFKGSNLILSWEMNLAFESYAFGLLAQIQDVFESHQAPETSCKS